MTPETPKYPEDSVQAALGQSWWEPATSSAPKRGRLIWAFCPVTNLVPKTLQPIERSEATTHDRARFELAPMRAGENAKAPKIPVAGLITPPGEVLAVFRAKKRPMLVLSTGGPELTSDQLKEQGRSWWTHGMLLAAPYFGADQSGTRGGLNPEFIRRIRHAKFPQYLLDQLPLSGPTSSVLRLDQLQPIGRHHDSYELTPWQLGKHALALVDEWLAWLFTGEMEPEGPLATMREYLPSLEITEK
jgi:hypothetical protein